MLGVCWFLCIFQENIPRMNPTGLFGGSLWKLQEICQFLCIKHTYFYNKTRDDGVAVLADLRQQTIIWFYLQLSPRVCLDMGTCDRWALVTCPRFLNKVLLRYRILICVYTFAHLHPLLSHHVSTKSLVLGMQILAGKEDKRSSKFNTQAILWNRV